MTACPIAIVAIASKKKMVRPVAGVRDVDAMVCEVGAFADARGRTRVMQSGQASDATAGTSNFPQGQGFVCL